MQFRRPAGWMLATLMGVQTMAFAQIRYEIGRAHV